MTNFKFFKRPFTLNLSKFCSESFHSDTDRRFLFKCRKIYPMGKREKNGPPTNSTTVPPQNILLLLRYNLFMGVNEINTRKNINVTVSVRVSVTVRVSLVWFVVLVASSVAICRPAVCIAKCSQLSHGRPCDSWLHLAIHTAGHVFSIIFAFWLYTRPAVHGRPCV